MSDRSVTNKYDEERLRAAEQSQSLYLQGQIDELRRLLKDQNNKYGWVIEQVRKVEGNVSQIETLFDRYRQEIAQVLDSYRRDIATLRREIAGALVKVEESARPMREIQAQIQLLAETRKQDRDTAAAWLVRIDQVEQQLLGWPGQLRDLDERTREINTRIGGFGDTNEDVRAEMRRISEEFAVERQSLRRQAVEAQQLVTDLYPQLESYNSRIARLDEIRQHIEQFSEQVPGQIAAIEHRVGEHTGEIKRVERVAAERFLINQERVEEIRRVQEERVTIVEEAGQLSVRQVVARIERLDSWLREIEQRQNRVSTQTAAVDRDHSVHLQELEQRDVLLIDMLIHTLRSRLETIRAGQIERGVLPPEGGTDD